MSGIMRTIGEFSKHHKFVQLSFWVAIGSLLLVLRMLWQMGVPVKNREYKKNAGQVLFIVMFIVLTGIDLTYFETMNTVHAKVPITHHCTVSITNTTPYYLKAAITYPLNSDEWEIYGWKQLPPGDSWEFDQIVREVNPEFYVYAESDDDKLIGWIYSLSPSSDGSSTICFQGTDLERTVEPGSMDYRIASKNAALRSADAYPVGFQAMAVSPKHKNRFFSVLRPPRLFPDLDDSEALTESQIKTTATRAWCVHTSMSRQMRFESQWKEKKYFPFSPGFEVEDRNGPFQRGVTITRRQAVLPGNYPMPFKVGDELISFDNADVYGPGDVAILLYEHGNSRHKGIKKSIPFSVLRDGKEYSGQTTYWFVKEYFENRNEAVTDGRTLLWGAFDSAVLGYGPEVGAGAVVTARSFANGIMSLGSMINEDYEPNYIKRRSYDALKWQNYQAEAMGHQWHGGAYLTGEIVGFFVNLPRAVAMRVGAKSFKLFAKSKFGAVVYEVAETTVWTVQEGSPLRSSDELKEELRRVLPLAAAGGFVQGVFGPKRIPKRGNEESLDVVLKQEKKLD